MPICLKLQRKFGTFAAHKMLDINLFRTKRGGNPDIVKKSQHRRGADESLVDTVIELDTKWLEYKRELDTINMSMNTLQKSLASIYKKKEDPAQLLEEKSEKLKNKQKTEQNMMETEKERDKILQKIGNLVHDSVVDSSTEDDNNVVHRWDPEEKGRLPERLLSHDQVLERIAGYDSERGAKVMGHRGYFLLGAGVDLNQALINYALDFLAARKYTKIMTPFMMKREYMAKTAQLSDFDESLYTVLDGTEEKYLIATSEQPISAFHAGEWFDSPEKQLPIRYAGYSTCFRKEAGSYGRDTWGIFRVHQFEKVEQFVLTDPSKSWDMFEEMIELSKEFYRSLGLPHRVVGIVSGGLNDAAAKKYDLEAFFPFQNSYKELVSCSNCLDYQSRRLEIRCGQVNKESREKQYVHCLNSTMCATERTICCILENYQRENGVEIPLVLRPYIGNKETLPYIAKLKTTEKHMNK